MACVVVELLPDWLVCALGSCSHAAAAPACLLAALVPPRLTPHDFEGVACPTTPPHPVLACCCQPCRSDTSITVDVDRGAKKRMNDFLSGQVGRVEGDVA